VSLDRIGDYATRGLPPDDGEYDGPRFHGPWAARVSNNNDPDKMGRLEVIVSQVSGTSPHPRWAWPSATMLSPGKDRGSLWLPETDDWIIVEFENGNPNYPMWRGAWHAKGELHADLKTNYPNRRGFVTKAGHQLIFDDTSGSEKIIVKHSSGIDIVFEANKITMGGGSHPLLLADDFLDDLKQFLSDLSTLLGTGSTGPGGGPVTFSGLAAFTPQLATFQAKLANITYRSQKVKTV
jgi:hypothetical protein